jgi:hypothetical protein
MHNSLPRTTNVIESDKSPANFTGVYVGREKRISPLSTRQSQFLARFDQLARLNEASFFYRYWAAAFVPLVPNLKRITLNA